MSASCRAPIFLDHLRYGVDVDHQTWTVGAVLELVPAVGGYYRDIASPDHLHLAFDYNLYLAVEDDKDLFIGVAVPVGSSPRRAGHHEEGDVSSEVDTFKTRRAAARRSELRSANYIHYAL